MNFNIFTSLFFNLTGGDVTTTLAPTTPYRGFPKYVKLMIDCAKVTVENDKFDPYYVQLEIRHAHWVLNSSYDIRKDLQIINKILWLGLMDPKYAHCLGISPLVPDNSCNCTTANSVASLNEYECDDDGQCNCMEEYYGKKCKHKCNCDEKRSKGKGCDKKGQCECKETYHGMQCQHECGCNDQNSEGKGCDKDGQCPCKGGFTGKQCDEACGCKLPNSANNTCTHKKQCFCKDGYTGFICDKPCGCTGDAVKNVCDAKGQCPCNPGFKGLKCETSQLFEECLSGATDDLASPYIIFGSPDPVKIEEGEIFTLHVDTVLKKQIDLGAKVKITISDGANAIACLDVPGFKLKIGSCTYDIDTLLKELGKDDCKEYLPANQDCQLPFAPGNYVSDAKNKTISFTIGDLTPFDEFKKLVAGKTLLVKVELLDSADKAIGCLKRAFVINW